MCRSRDDTLRSPSRALHRVEGAVPVQSAAAKLLVLHDGFHGNYQLLSGVDLNHVTPCAEVEGFSHDISRGFLSEENNSCIRSKFADSASGIDSVQPGQTDIEQNQVGLQSLGLTDGFQPVRHLTDDPQICLLAEHRGDKPPNGFIIINHKNADLRTCAMGFQ